MIETVPAIRRWLQPLLTLSLGLALLAAGGWVLMGDPEHLAADARASGLAATQTHAAATGR